MRLIKEHAVASALAMREGAGGNELLARLAADERFPLDRAALEGLLGEPLSFTGAATSQVAAVVARVQEVVARYPQAAGYRPGAIL